MTCNQLQISSKQVTKLYIQGGERLDPLTVFLDDIAPGKGQITISCFGKSWTAFWPRMGEDETIASWFAGLNVKYAIGCMDSTLQAEAFSASKAMEEVKGRIISRRREEDLDATKARQLFDEAQSLCDATSMEDIFNCHNQLMVSACGEEWWYDLDEAKEPNSDYTYLCRIITTVQQAITQTLLQKAG